jgi:hypothetical protein
MLREEASESVLALALQTFKWRERGPALLHLCIMAV